MKVLLRSAGGLLAGILLFGGLGPWMSGRIQDLRMARSAPVQVESVRQKLALLPKDAQNSPAVQQLQEALRVDGQLREGEQRWSRGIATLLSDAQREEGLAKADLLAPSPPPPLEATGVDGDVSHLATLLLERYGYPTGDMPEVPARDPWVGVDRRSRTRMLVALAEQNALQPEQARQISLLTLQLLEEQLQRSENLKTVERLLPVAMGSEPQRP